MVDSFNSEIVQIISSNKSNESAETNSRIASSDSLDKNENEHQSCDDDISSSSSLMRNKLLLFNDSTSSFSTSSILNNIASNKNNLNSIGNLNPNASGVDFSLRSELNSNSMNQTILVNDTPSFNQIDLSLKETASATEEEEDEQEEEDSASMPNCNFNELVNTSALNATNTSIIDQQESTPSIGNHDDPVALSPASTSHNFDYNKSIKTLNGDVEENQEIIIGNYNNNNNRSDYASQNEINGLNKDSESSPNENSKEEELNQEEKMLDEKSSTQNDNTVLAASCKIMKNESENDMTTTISSSASVGKMDKTAFVLATSRSPLKQNLSRNIFIKFLFSILEIKKIF
jgi:hypothetical protein